jgi:hypothetical protein
MASRFAYIPFDEIAAKEQNELREKFIKYEERLKSRDDVFMLDFEIPDNEYKPIAERVKNMILDYPTLQVQLLELFYFIVGKDIRLRVIKRLGLKNDLISSGVKESCSDKFGDYADSEQSNPGEVCDEKSNDYEN